MTLEKSKRCTNDLIMEKSLGGTCLTSATNVKKKITQGCFSVTMEG